MSNSGSGGNIEKRFRPFQERMQKYQLPQAIIDLFYKYYSMLVSSSPDMSYIKESDIEPVKSADIAKRQNLSQEHEETGRKYLDQSVMIKLNGGLGTSMGMPYAKSLLKVKSGKTFLDIVFEQSVSSSYKGKIIPLVFMNSFNTDKDTRHYFQQKGVSEEQRPLYFVQNRYPKVLVDSLEPAQWSKEKELEWNPPGHGDLYGALYVSGTLDYLLEQDKRFAFVSNVDNLGAVIDPAILGYFVQNELPFLMEVATRSPADKKGGHLAKQKDGRLILREIAQCAENDLSDFQDISKHSFFNTNNIWIDLKHLKDYIKQHGLPELPLIVNPKTLDPRDEQSPKVYQLETAMGAAISAFARSGAIQVERDRFIPVKKTNDLLAVRSDCFILDEDFKLKPNPRRNKSPIVIELDSDYYKKIDQYESRFPYGPPSLLECESLEVKGDILFEKDITCRGKVRIKNESSQQQRVKAGSELKGDIFFHGGQK